MLSHVWLCDSLDCSWPGSSVCGILGQKHWGAVPFPTLGDLPDLEINLVSCIGRWILYHWATWEAHKRYIVSIYLGVGSLIPCCLNSLGIDWTSFIQFTLRPARCNTPEIHLNVQFSSVAQSCPTLCDPMECSTPGLPVHHQLLEFTQTHVHWVSDAIQPSHPLSSLLFLPSIFPSIRVFSNESALTWMVHTCPFLLHAAMRNAFDAHGLENDRETSGGLFVLNISGSVIILWLKSSEISRVNEE